MFAGSAAAASLSLLRLHFHSLQTSLSSHSSSVDFTSNFIEKSDAAHISPPNIYKSICVGLCVFSVFLSFVITHLPWQFVSFFVTKVHLLQSLGLLSCSEYLFHIINFSVRCSFKSTNMLCNLPALEYMQTCVNVMTRYIKFYPSLVSSVHYSCSSFYAINFLLWIVFLLPQCLVLLNPLCGLFFTSPLNIGRP